MFPVFKTFQRMIRDYERKKRWERLSRMENSEYHVWGPDHRQGPGAIEHGRGRTCDCSK